MPLLRPSLCLLLSVVCLGPTGTRAADDSNPVQAKPKRLSFVTCPVVRDTKTVPVWLAKYEGEWYYLGIQQDISSGFYPPQLKHDVLVEGTVSDEPKICGATVLSPLTISVIEELNCNCNTILPAEPGLEAPDAHRPAGPATHRRERAPMVRERLAAPYEPREFEVLFTFDSHYLPLRSTGVVSDAYDYARTINATSVEIDGYRATTLLSNGHALVERADIAADRANKIGAMFTGLGVPAENVHVTAHGEPTAGDGVTDHEHRRVTIRVAP